MEVIGENGKPVHVPVDTWYRYQGRGPAREQQWNYLTVTLPQLLQEHEGRFRLEAQRATSAVEAAGFLEKAQEYARERATAVRLHERFDVRNFQNNFASKDAIVERDGKMISTVSFDRNAALGT